MINIRQFYYRKVYVLFEIVKALKNREMAFIDHENSSFAIRGMNVKTIDYLKLSFFDFCHFLEKNYNIYMSCAKYEDIPNFTFNLSNRSGETKIWFKNEAKELIRGYDLFLDFDLPEKEEEKKDYINEVFTFFALLKEHNICFRMVFSGSGYQIVINSDTYGFDYRNDELIDNVYMKPYVLIKQIQERFKLKYLCISGAGVYNKLMKCPYSLVEDRVVFPVTIPQFQQIFNANYVLKHYVLRGRGLCFLNDRGAYTNNMFFNKFCKKFHIKI